MISGMNIALSLTLLSLAACDAQPERGAQRPAGRESEADKRARLTRIKKCLAFYAKRDPVADADAAVASGRPYPIILTHGGESVGTYLPGPERCEVAWGAARRWPFHQYGTINPVGLPNESRCRDAEGRYATAFNTRLSELKPGLISRICAAAVYVPPGQLPAECAVFFSYKTTNVPADVKQALARGDHRLLAMRGYPVPLDKEFGNPAALIQQHGVRWIDRASDPMVPGCQTAEDQAYHYISDYNRWLLGAERRANGDTP